MGALCVVTCPTGTLTVGSKPADEPTGGVARTDGVRKTAANSGATFPYPTTSLSGNFNLIPAAGRVYQ